MKPGFQSQFLQLSLRPLYFRSELGLPDHVEDMCPLLPSLEQALGDVKQLAGAGAGARQSQYIHVTEVILPMLCSYMSLWWSWGPEGQPDSPACSSVTPQHASDLLGHVLRIIHNHVGTSQAGWMQQMAGILVYARHCCGVQNAFFFLFVFLIITVSVPLSSLPANHMPCPP